MVVAKRLEAMLAEDDVMERMALIAEFLLVPAARGSILRLE